jgi:hypothetical protein
MTTEVFLCFQANSETVLQLKLLLNALMQLSPFKITETNPLALNTVFQNYAL